MKFKNCLWKRSLGEITFYHTKSDYRVIVDEDTLGVLCDMCSKTEKELTERQRDYYQKLAAKNMMEPGIGEIPQERSQSPLAYVEIEVSSACNLNCKHCFACNEGGFIDIDFFYKLLEELRKLGAIVVSFNGGEPLLHPHLIPMMQRTYNEGFSLILFTNGTLLTPEFCEKIGAMGLNKVYVSLDGFRHQHELMRGEGTFDQTVRGVSLLRKNGIRVWINSMIHPGNENEVAAFKQFCCQELGVNGMRLSPVQPIGNARENLAMFQYPQNAQKSLVDLPDMETVNTHPNSRTLPCCAGISQIYIAANGNFYPCDFFRRASMSLGNALQSALSELYQAHLAQDSILTNFDCGKLTSCQGCSAFSTCKGGCRARALLLNQDIYSKDPLACAKRGLLKE